MSDKYVYCANCKTVFVMDADSHINECPACDVPNSTLEIPECVASELARRDARIAELEDFINQLIEVGDKLTINPTVGNYEERECKWQKLVQDWKEG